MLQFYITSKRSIIAYAGLLGLELLQIGVLNTSNTDGWLNSYLFALVATLAAGGVVGFAALMNVRDVFLESTESEKMQESKRFAGFFGAVTFALGSQLCLYGLVLLATFLGNEPGTPGLTYSTVLALTAIILSSTAGALMTYAERNSGNPEAVALMRIAFFATIACFPLALWYFGIQTNLLLLLPLALLAAIFTVRVQAVPQRTKGPHEKVITVSLAE